MITHFVKPFFAPPCPLPWGAARGGGKLESPDFKEEMSPPALEGEGRGTAPGEIGSPTETRAPGETA